MITLVIFFSSLGTFGFKPASLASINYEPIKITVNQNYYAQPEFERQAENIYSKPNINLPPGYIPSYIKALISSIKQKSISCSKETSELMEKELSEILKPISDPIPVFTKETLPGIVSRKETITEIIKLLEDLLTELVTTTEEDKKNVEVVKPTIIIENKLELPPSPPTLSTPIIIKGESNLITPELSVIIESPKLPPVSRDIVDEQIIEEPVLLEESIQMSPPIKETPTLLLLDTSIVPEKLSPSYMDDEPYPITSKVGIIPEVPVLPTLSLATIPSITQKIKIEEQVLLEESVVSPPFPEMSTVLLPDTRLQPEELLPPPPPLSIPIKINDDVNPAILEVEIKPELSVLAPLPLDIIHPIAAGVKSKELVFLGELSPPIQEISTAILPGTSLESTELPPLLPPLPILSLIKHECNPVTSEVKIIPEAPVFTPLSLDSILSKVTIEEPILLEESELSRPIQESFPIVLPYTNIVPEELPPPPTPLPRPIKIINDEPNPVTSDVVAIPEAPILLPLSHQIVPPNAEKVKVEEPILLEKSEVSREYQEISQLLIPNTRIKSEDFPSLPPSLPIPINMNDAPYPVTPENIFFPVDTVLLSLSLDNMSAFNEKVKIEEQMSEINIEEPILEESEVSRPVQEISAILIQDTNLESKELPPPPPPLPIPIKIIDEPIAVTSENEIIPEAPILPSLLLDVIPPIIEEERNEEPILTEEPEEVSPPIQKISIEPLLEPGLLSKDTLILENHSPIVVEEINMKELTSLEDSIEHGYTPIVQMYPRPILEPIAVPKITNSKVLKEVSQIRPCSKCLTKEKINSSIFPTSTKRLKLFTNIPFLSHLSTRLPTSTSNENIIPKLTSREPYLIQPINKNQGHGLPLVFSKNPHNIMMKLKSERNNRFELYTSFAHDIIEKRIAPYLAFRKSTPYSIKKYVPIKRFQLNKLHL